MPEGPHFHPRVLPSNPDESLAVPERSISASPQPSTVVQQSTAIMRKDSGAAVSVLSNISNNNNNNYEPDDAKVAPRRGRCHRNSSSLSAGNKKVSFSEDHARNNAAIAAATALLNNRNVSNEETVSTLSADRERSPAGSEENSPSGSLELAAPLSNARPAVQRAQSQRDARSAVAISNGGTAAGNNASAVTNRFKYKSKRSASFRDGLLRQGESYQVLMLGAVGVGKSSLVRQFQSGGHVSVKVSNVYGDNCRRANDAQLTIVDNPAMEITAEMVISCCDADAYVIVYSVTDGDSFKTAQNILQALAGQENRNQKAAILVGNKVDLVRRRVVNTEEGKACATSYGSKFIETSDWINYNVDELFAGVLSQIRLRLNAHLPPTASSASPSSSAAINGNGAPNGVGGSTKSRGGKRESRGYRRSKTLGAKSWGVIKDLINKINRKVKSCDDLHVL